MAQSSITAVLLIVLLSLKLSFAQSCWRDTVCTGPADTAFPGVWESNIFAPASRTVAPKSILSITTGDVVSAFPGPANLAGNGSQVVFDFGMEVGGIITIEYTSTGDGAIGLAFTEAKNFIGEWSDSSNGAFMGPDGAIYANITAGSGTYTMPDLSLRGGFRYMTAFLIETGTTTVDITDVSLEFEFQPTWSNLRAYQGYFHSNDELLNRIWYGGAYTIQSNFIPVNTGRQVPFLTTGWANNATVGPGDTIIVDGAKRDRAVWPGDMGVAVPSTFVSIGDLTSVKNSLQTMYNTQNQATGAFAESGPPLNQLGSDTYHMWTMIGTYNYVLFSNDTSFLLQNWAGYLKAMTYIESHMTYESGLLNVTGIRDWARFQQGFNNSEAQMILYHTFTTGANLAPLAGDTTGLNATWTAKALALQTAINTFCWDDQFGAFKDNASTTDLHPQDANSLAVLFGVVDEDRAQNISEKLTLNWGPLGAQSPELPDNISPFISSFEIQAHLTLGQTERALELIRRSWGWYVNNPNGSESTLIEGYLQNGSFGYRATRGYDFDTSYVSHSHGWSSGPTSALTNYILGLSVTSLIGATWKLAPQFGDLSSVQGGFTTPLGTFQASWEVFKDGYTIEYNVPVGTKGELVLPPFPGSSSKVVMDGMVMSNVKQNAGPISVTASGGSHSISVS